MRLAGCRVYNGHLQNQMSDKNFFVSIQKVANLSVSSPAFRSCVIYTVLVEIARYLEIPLIDFCETSHNRKQAPKVQVGLSISKENANKGGNSI